MNVTRLLSIVAALTLDMSVGRKKLSARNARKLKRLNRAFAKRCKFGSIIATDSFFAGGHPGYPQDSATFENNQIYSNNFNSFVQGSDVEPKVPTPVGVGILIAGGNNNQIRGNRIYDNWRRGTMLIFVPDQLSDETKTTANSTSHRNRYHDNVMGIAPNGTKIPNGVDFWWDEAPGQEDNCWYDNGAVTTDTCPWLRSPEKPSSGGGGPMGLPAHASGVPKLTLPTGNCRIVGSTLSCDGLLDRP